MVTCWFGFFITILHTFVSSDNNASFRRFTWTSTLTSILGHQPGLGVEMDGRLVGEERAEPVLDGQPVGLDDRGVEVDPLLADVPA